MVARGQERAVLTVDRIDDLLAAQLVEAQFAHVVLRSARVYRISARPSSLSSRAICEMP